jgi:hypothetical protein
VCDRAELIGIHDRLPITVTLASGNEFFFGACKPSQRVVPLRLERIGDESIIGVRWACSTTRR